ncbi:hypothetical protein BS47DRAFT_1349456 [Hydnum rufescens UP504]|uniref:Major facilitator superfamily (MFS) profile domain-containing protein n=1 Tax=Hydnum rufescens UP504 TaxID=1448309 RepID=A0A9P6APG5_9AGAM|nr:hypothetical protein BS47DRAFT_1349456 [Hydnum rufescens UP504]
MVLNIAAGNGFTAALPTIGKDLHIMEGNLQWVVSSYTLTSGCFLLLFGRLADIYGRRVVFLIGIAWFIVFTIGCGFVHNEISMDVMRAFQGLGPAASIPAALGILAQSFERGSTIRTIAFATFSSGAPIGGAFGGTMGGALTQLTKLSWRSAFFFNAGLGALTFVIGLLAIDPDRHHLNPNLDRRTAVRGWRTGYIIATLILSLVLIAVFIYWEWVLDQEADLPSGQSGRAQPLVSLKLFGRANGRLAVMQTMAFFIWAGFCSWIYQNYLGLTPILSMLRMLPMSVTGVFCNVVVALAVAHVQGIILVALGCIMTGLAPLLFAVIKVNAPYWAFGFPSAILSVVGADFIFASGSIYVAKVSLPHEQSLAAGTVQYVDAGRRFSLSCICHNVIKVNPRLTYSSARLVPLSALHSPSVVLDKTISKETRRLNASQPAVSPQVTAKAALLAGYRAVQWLNFGFVMFGLVLALVFLRDIGVIARKPRPPVHPQGEPKLIGPDEKQSPIYVEDIETLGFENPAPHSDVGVATREPSEGQTRTS